MIFLTALCRRRWYISSPCGRYIVWEVTFGGNLLSICLILALNKHIPKCIWMEHVFGWVLVKIKHGKNVWCHLTWAMRCFLQYSCPQIGITLKNSLSQQMMIIFILGVKWLYCFSLIFRRYFIYQFWGNLVLKHHGLNFSLLGLYLVLTFLSEWNLRLIYILSGWGWRAIYSSKEKMMN